jgi:hypothetical protein
MSYSPYAHAPATTGRLGLIKASTGISVALDGTVTTSSVPNGVVTTGSYSDPSWLTLTKSKVGLGSVDNESKATMFSSPTFTGTVSGVTKSHVGLGNVDNESKATMFSSPTFTGTVSGVTKSHVGLGSVDNTADSAKSVSYASTAGRAYPYRSDGGNLNFYWSGQSGQPTWLWGGSDGENMYVYNPSNFSVNYAATAGSAPASDVYSWAKAATKPSYTATEVGLSNVGNYTVNQNVGTGNDVTHNTVTAAAFYYSSDATLKTNINNLTNYWEILDKLRPVSFDWILNGKKDLGLLAQDVQGVLPESVKRTNDGTLAISSSGIIAHLVAAVKDLKSQVEDLTKQLKG